MYLFSAPFIDGHKNDRQINLLHIKIYAMKTKRNTFGVVFYLRKYKTNRGKAPIYARITVDGKRVDISIKSSIEEKFWNGNKGLAKGSRLEIQTLNQYLEKIKAKIVNHYQEMILDGKLVTAEGLKNKFLGIDKQEDTLCKLIEYHNTQMQQILTWGTMKNYFTTQKYLGRFLTKKFGTNDIYLSEINYKFIIDFEFFLRFWKPVDHQRPLRNNGIMKHMERFQKMINLAKRLEWMINDPFSNYKLKFEKVQRGFLLIDELLTIEEKEFKIERLKQVKDLFVFSCYTGLSYIDLINLTPEHVTVGIDGLKWINTNRQKSKNPVKIPLLPKAIAIIEKYKMHPKVIHEGKLLPGMSNQKLNTYLKEIADLCEIDKNLTFHIARHTFATTVTLTNGVPIESISKMLGHTKLSTTQIYAKVVETKLSYDMNELRNKLETSETKRQKTKPAG